MTESFTTPEAFTVDASFDCDGVRDGLAIILHGDGEAEAQPVRMRGFEGHRTLRYRSPGRHFLEIRTSCAWRIVVRREEAG